MARVGIFSGTFDPVHAGHIAFCNAALDAAGLDKIVLLPEPQPRGKAQASPLQHRRAMLELAVQAEPRLEVLALPGARFTVAETLPQLEQRFAGDELFLLAGSDVVRGFAHGWPGLDTLLARMGLVIGLRGQDTRAGVQRLLAGTQGRFPGTPLHAVVVGSPRARAASSAIRAHAPEAAQHLSPHVAAYIERHQLYAASPA